MPRRDRALTRAWFLVAVGIVAVSMSGPLSTSPAAPALAIAFWRTALGTLVTVPVAVPGRSRRPPGSPRSRRPRWPGRGWPGRRDGVGAGVLLAVHFGTWIPSLRLTSVATATALVATSPLWIVLFRRLAGVPVPRAVVVGSLVGVGGVLLVTAGDVTGSGRPASDVALGDALALVGGAAHAGYAMIGERARRGTSTARWTAVVYGVCAVSLLPACLVLGVPLAGWGRAGWMQILLITVTAQLLGHTAFNAAVPHVGASSLTLAILLEVPGAAAIAWVWLGQVPAPVTVPGLVAVLAGLVLVVRGDRRAPGAGRGAGQGTDVNDTSLTATSGYVADA